MNREGKPVSAARIRNASADLKEIQSRVKLLFLIITI